MRYAVGHSIPRKESWAKVSGRAKYTGDLPAHGTFFARLLTSPYAHARILRIDTSGAESLEGVKAVITGSDCPWLFGIMIRDRPAIALNEVRYAGEPVAMVVAVDEATAELGVRAILVEYEPLPFVIKPSEALAEGAVLLHPQLAAYRKVVDEVYPEAGTNIASRYRIRKGDIKSAFSNCDVVVSARFFLPPSDHFAMEVRCAEAAITADGTVLVTTSSQSPYSVRQQLSDVFNILAGKIRVNVPFVGGGFGGKSSVVLEILAYIASKKLGGKPVRLIISREQDMETAPCRIGLETDIKLGALRDGTLLAAEITYLVDCGAYSDIAPNMAKAIAVDCTGPYNIPNVSCDSLCVYTNHTFATAYRSFAHESQAFCIERAVDMVARKCGMCPLELRLKNAIRSGDYTPTQVLCTPSIIGDLPQCIEKVKLLSNWNGGKPMAVGPNKVRAMGISCLWKTENPPTDAISGALVTFNSDGSLYLNTGVAEIGSGGKTHLAQILAETLKIDAGQVHVISQVDTALSPEHWKTVASFTEYMAGNAVYRAAQDILNQLRANGAEAFKCSADEIEVENGRVYRRGNPSSYIEFKDIVGGYKAQDGSSLGEPVLGRGGFMLKGLTALDKNTGRGRTGPAWTVGAQVVEIEADLKDFSYRILSASSVIDVGAVINPELMRSVVAGGMAMGMSMASREAFFYDEKGLLKTPNLRTYKLMHIGQEPDYRVGFVETPEDGSPYGVRPYSEHGIIGIPAALANALSAAFGKEITSLPLTPEMLWRLWVEGMR